MQFINSLQDKAVQPQNSDTIWYLQAVLLNKIMSQLMTTLTSMLCTGPNVISATSGARWTLRATNNSRWTATHVFLTSMQDQRVHANSIKESQAIIGYL